MHIVLESLLVVKVALVVHLVVQFTVVEVFLRLFLEHIDLMLFLGKLAIYMLDSFLNSVL